MALRLGVVQLPADGAEQLAQRLDVLLVGFFRVRQEFLDARVHDALGEHLLLEQLADEPDVPQHAPARLQQTVRALHHGAALGQVQLLRRLGRGGRPTPSSFSSAGGVGGASPASARALASAASSASFSAALIAVSPFSNSSWHLDRPRTRLNVITTGFSGSGDAGSLNSTPSLVNRSAERRAHRGVELGERRLGERLVEELADEPHQRLRLVDALLQDLLQELVKVLGGQLVQNTLECALLLLLLVHRALVDGHELVLRLHQLRQPRVRAVRDGRAVVAETAAVIAAASLAALLVGGQARVTPPAAAATAAPAAAGRAVPTGHRRARRGRPPPPPPPKPGGTTKSTRGQ